MLLMHCHPVSPVCMHKGRLPD